MTSAEATGVTAARAPRPGGRLIDRGAIFAGWVGLGMAIVIVISFELIFAVQAFVFLAAPLAGAVIGAYANVRSERWRPRARVLANALYAGLVTSLGLTLLYVALRLLFIFADDGYPLFNRTDPASTLLPLYCAPGPDCTHQRYIAAGRREELAAAGVTDAATFEAFVLREHLQGGLTLILLTTGGALVAGGLRSLRNAPAGEEPTAPIGG